MVVQIENPETLRLVEELTRGTGQSAKRVIDVALRERLARLRTPEEEAARRARVYEIVKDLQAQFKASGLPLIDHGDLLYDENGLPREGELSEVELRWYFPERYTSPRGPTTNRGEPWPSRSKSQQPSA